MAKMGFEAVVSEIEKSYTTPGTSFFRVMLRAEDLKNYGLRKKKGTDDPSYLVWAIGFGEAGTQLSYFYDYKLLDAAKKAYEWKTGSTAAG